MFAVAITSGRPASSAVSLLALSCVREHGLQDRIGARRAAAQVRIGDRQRARMADREQDLLDLAADAAGRAAACTANGTRSAAGPGPSRSSARSSSIRRRRPRPGRARARRSRFALSAYAGSCAQQMAVVLDHHAAAAGGDDDRLRRRDATSGHQASMLRCARSSRASSSPSGDAAARRSSRRRRTRSGEMPMRSSTRAIAASMFGASEGCTQPSSTSILRACRGGGHAPAGCASRNAIGELARQQALDHAAQRQRAAEQRPRQQARATASSAARASGGVRPTALVDERAGRCRRSRPYCDARRARRLAVAAREAAVEVQLRLRGDRAALEHLLDQVDAPARPVELVAEQLVRRARRRAEAAMHARAQDGVGLAALAACRG